MVSVLGECLPQCSRGKRYTYSVLEEEERYRKPADAQTDKPTKHQIHQVAIDNDDSNDTDALTDGNGDVSDVQDVDYHCDEYVYNFTDVDTNIDEIVSVPGYQGNGCAHLIGVSSDVSRNVTAEKLISKPGNKKYISGIHVNQAHSHSNNKQQNIDDVTFQLPLDTTGINHSSHNIATVTKETCFNNRNRLDIYKRNKKSRIRPLTTYSFHSNKIVDEFPVRRSKSLGELLPW
jgi:hypothetical protein